MKLINILRSGQYWQFAISAWLLSYLLLPGSQSQNNLTYIAVLAPLLISLRFTELKELFRDLLFICLLVMILTLIGASFIAGDPLGQAKFGAIVILFYLAIARIPAISNIEAYKIAWACLLVLTMYVIYNMLWKYHLGLWIPGNRLLQLTGKLENPIYVTDTMAGMLAVITFAGIQARKTSQVIAAHFITLAFSLLVLQTRSIIPIWIVTLVITYFALKASNSQPYKKPKTLLISALILGILLASYGLLHTSIGQSLLARNLYRPEIWQGYFAETLRCGILVGCGPEHDFRYISHDGYIMVNPHNIFLAQLYKAGLIGLMPLLIMSVWGAIDGYRKRYWAAWFFIAGIIGLCVDGSTLIHSPNQRWLVFHLPLALLIATRLQQKRFGLSDKPNSNS